ncbi:hypothetical protein HDU80_000157 [Chytriomyces hyalinus]|nr:hypothetical protein HDU80_000157 [Chytriomyces hyalinus]
MRIKRGIHGVPGMSEEVRSAFQSARAAITSEASASSSQPAKRQKAKAGFGQAQDAKQELTSINESRSDDFEVFDGFDNDTTRDEDSQCGNDADDEDAEAADELWGPNSVESSFDAFAMNLTKQVKLLSSAAHAAYNAINPDSVRSTRLQCTPDPLVTPSATRTHKVKRIRLHSLHGFDDADIIVCKLHSSATILCDAGFFPSAPTDPVAAFSFEILEITLKFQNEKSNKVSNYGASMALFNHHEFPYLNKVHDMVYKQFNKCLNEYSIVKHLFNHCRFTAETVEKFGVSGFALVFQCLTGYQVGRTTCPCSGGDIPTESNALLNTMPDPKKLPRIFANDGNFQMKHKAIDFGGGGTHAQPDIPKGEKLSLYFSVLKHLQDKYPSSQILNFYDIMCKADAHYDIHWQRLNALNISPTYIGLMPVLHAYAHGKACQVKFSGKLVMGAGTFDGEVIERFWAYISNHIGRTQRQTIENRADAIFLMVEHAAADKNKVFCKSIEQWCKAAMDEIVAIKLEAAEASAGTFCIRPYCDIVEENRKHLNQSNTGSHSNIFKTLVKNKSPDVLREAEMLWSAICNMSIKLERKKSSVKAKESADAAKKVYRHLSNLIDEFNDLPNKDDVDLAIETSVGTEDKAQDTTLVLAAIRSDLVIKVVQGNPNALQEQYWRRIEDLYHHGLDLQRGVEAYKSKVREYKEICDTIEGSLQGCQLTAALFFLNAAKQKAQENSDKCFDVWKMVTNSVAEAGLTDDVAQVKSGFEIDIHQSANNKQQ